MDNLLIHHNAEWERFELLEAGSVIGKAAYKDYDDGGSAARQRIFYHTVINEEYGGQGLAGKLVTEALDQTVASGLQIVPVCAFIEKFLGRHPNYAEHVIKPTLAHLSFLDAALAQRLKA